MRKITQAALVLLVGLLAMPAFAKSESLWAERAPGSPPLAQVPDFRNLAKKLVPAVVSIQVEQDEKVSSGTLPQDPFEYFHRFFGDMPHSVPTRGIGSGFVIRKDGLILTNNHVVENANVIQVTFEDVNGVQHTMGAKVLGTAPEYDVALIKTDHYANAPIAYLGNSDDMAIGDWVMAIGNPFGLSHSVSVGIISAKGRRDIAPSGRRGLYNFLQTDASINPGNSGGPLIDMRGEVIGINTAINAAGSGIGFAIPINMVKELLPSLKKNGKFTRSWIGIKIQPLSDDLATSYGLKRPEGALVSEVVPNSPAAKAGLKSQDIILTFDGKEVKTSSDLPLYASMAGVGKTVDMKIWRDGHTITRSVTLAAFPTNQDTLAQSGGEERGELGMTVADVTPDLQRQFNLGQDRGVVIKSVDPAGVAAQAGLMAGDVVLTLNGRNVNSARQFANAVHHIKRGGILRIQINRQGGHLFLAMRKP